MIERKELDNTRQYKTTRDSRKKRREKNCQDQKFFNF